MNTVEDLIEEFEDLDEREACQVLDELGRELPKLPDSVYVKENLVPGCQSRVWIVCQLSGGPPRTLEIQADSDAIVVKGLVHVLLQMYGGLTPEEVLNLDYEKVFESLGLARLITPQRKNGLFSMVQTIRRFAAEQSGAESAEPAAKPLPDAPAVPARPIEGIVDEFPILRRPLPDGNRPVFLDSGASSQKPRQVIDKEREVEEEYYANAFRGRYYFGQRIDDEIESARLAVARLVGATRREEIAFTAGTTLSLNMVAFGWGREHVRAGDEIVITEMEHHANYVPWQVLAKETGARLRVVPVTDQGRLDMDAMREAIGPRTAMVAVCSMSNVLGTINPIRSICEMAHQHEAVVVVDAAQSVPHAATDVIADGVDFLAFSGHKVYGPSGVGVLYGRHELLQRMNPLIYGGHMIREVHRQESSWAQPPAKFEAGTMPIVQIIGLGAAIEFIESIGFDAIESVERKLLVEAQTRLVEIDGLRILGPPVDEKGAIVSFAIDGVATEDLAIRLDRRGVFTRHGHHCAMVLHERFGVPATTRASFGLYNTSDDVDTLVDAVSEAVHELR